MTEALVDILVVLLAAKVAAEASERVGLPSVVGEILAGIVIGPSVFGLVGSNEVLSVLGEIGVILLLLEVGLQMDLGELGAVGRAALLVAVVGIVVPFVTGAAVGLGFGFSSTEALFVGAALTATSVGITARVFGDLRALAMVEARTVLGAAVADDVLGLLLLTVVVRLATAGSISVGELAQVVGVAIGFLAVALVVGIRVVPPLFAAVARHSRSAGTLVAVALAFTLAVSELAEAAKLAPIVGAFVAGVVLGRSQPADRIRRELTPVGHLFIPVFFLSIGIQADVGAFADPYVLGIAAVLLVVAIAGKLASVAGMRGSPGDRLLVGFGMIPRGEVGLIFATIGLREAVFGQDIYATLLLVVLLSTLITPPLLRWRLLRLRASGAGVAGDDQPDSVTAAPQGGWLVPAGPQGGPSAPFELAARPTAGDALAVALDAAVLADCHPPGASVLDWLGDLPDAPLTWDDEARSAFFRLLDDGGVRSWRFLTVTGVLARALPEIDAAISRRGADPSDLDPTGALRWPRLDAVLTDPERLQLAYPERVSVAALALDAAADVVEAADLARTVADRLGWPEEDRDASADLAADAALLPAAGRRPDGLEEHQVLQLAVHLGDAEQVRALHQLARAAEPSQREVQAIEALVELLLAALAHPELTGSSGTETVARRRAEALALVDSDGERSTIINAPRALVLNVSPQELARHAALCEPRPTGSTVRVRVTDADSDHEWRVEVVAADRLGLLARVAGTLAAAGLDVVDAMVATWPDRTALVACRVRSFGRPDGDRLGAALRASLDEPLQTAPAEGIEVSFDDQASPWHTLCRIEAADRFGLLSSFTGALAAAEVDVHAARVVTTGDTVVDVFELTSPSGGKLSTAAKDAVRAGLARGVTTKKKRLVPRS